MAADASRLTDSDLDAIARAIDDYADRVHAEQRQAGRPLARLSTEERTVARRLAYQAIGCGYSDLRGSELELVDEYLALH